MGGEVPIPPSMVGVPSGLCPIVEPKPAPVPVACALVTDASSTTKARADAEAASGQVGAFACGLATFDAAGQVLDTWYPSPRMGINDSAAALAAQVGQQGSGTARIDRAQAHGQGLGSLLGAIGADERRSVTVVPVATWVEDLAKPPADGHDAYLRLHLLSHRLIQPHGCNMDGVFGQLANVVWTNAGPCPVENFETVRLNFRGAGYPLAVYGVDKFPRMTDYVVPKGVRIADADRVRLGAHLANGTTVMHEGFCNFNAGTLGASMVEGRISAGVVVGDGSDVGGGASIMGTLSGGGKEIIRVGRGCLIGANAGIGISLGDNCVVAAGTYVTAGSKVAMPNGKVLKALDLSGRDNMMLWTNTLSGRLEMVPRSKGWGELNADLHKN